MEITLIFGLRKDLTYYYYYLVLGKSRSRGLRI